jgi:mRNA interferase MazF
MIRGEIWWADFGIPFGSETGFRRPVLIIQDDNFNRSNIRTIIIVPLSSNLNLENAPGNVFIGNKESGLSKDSIIVVSQITAIDKTRLLENVKMIPNSLLVDVEDGLRMILNLKFG